MGVLLIAEDDEDIALVLARLGKRAGFTAVRAPDGAAALELAIAHRPGLILTDLGMPRMDGIELTRAVRADATLGETPIVMLSGHLHPGDQAPIEAGVCAVLLKPCPNDRLTAVLRELSAYGPHPHDPAGSSCPAWGPVGAGRG
jgi:CheY-like chemotaxis protein